MLTKQNHEANHEMDDEAYVEHMAKVAMSPELKMPDFTKEPNASLPQKAKESLFTLYLREQNKTANKH